MRNLVILSLLFISYQSIAQNEWTKSVDSLGVTWHTNGKDSMWSFHNKRAIMLRTGFGVQRSFYTELGISSYASTYSSHNGLGALGYYLSTEWTPHKSPNDNVYGIKAGAEFIGVLFGMGLEIKYQWNQEDKDYVFTPKYGVGFNHYIMLFYGYNLSINKNPFTRVRCHQFSMVTNLNRKSFKPKFRIPGH